MSKRLLDTETRYPEFEKLALTLVITSRKLRPYFHAHSIEVLTNYPLCQVLQEPKASRRFLKWAIELGQFDINYRPQTTINGQASVDFIVEFTYSNTTEVTGTTNIVEAVKKVKMEGDRITTKRLKDDNLNREQCVIYVDGASNKNGSGAGMMLIGPEGHKTHCAVCFVFQESNNEAK